MKKYEVGDLVGLPERIKFSAIAKIGMWIVERGRRIMAMFKVGTQVALPITKYPNVPGIVIQFDEKKDKYLVRFNGTQQDYFSEDELSPWEVL